MDEKLDEENKKEERENKLQKMYRREKLNTIEKIKISFLMRQHGWIYLIFEFSFAKIEIHLSSIFDPIPELLDFVRAIYEGSKTVKIQIDEEGIFKIIEYFKQDDDNTDIYVIKITSIRENTYNEYEFLKTISKRKFLTEFVNAFKNLGKENSEKTWYNYNLNSMITEKIGYIIKENIK